MSERPEYPKGAFWLDRDVAEHVIIVADKYFGGNRDLALNELVRVTMAMYAKPDDMWAGIERQKLAHWRGEREQRLNGER
jgi:hypothetical protein